MSHEMGRFFLPSKYFLKIFFEDVAGIKNISTFADPFAEAGAETGETVAALEFVL